MKDIFRLPILFLFVFILLFILFSALSLFAAWGSMLGEGREAALQVVLANVPSILVRALPAAVLVALFVLLVRIAASPGSRLLSLIIPLAGAFVLLAFGYQILHQLGPAAEAGDRAPRAAPSPRRYLVPGVFNTAAGKVIYVEQVDNRTVSPVVLAEGGSSEQELLYFPQGLVLVGEEAVIIRMAGYTLEIDPNPVYRGLFAEDPVLRRFFADLDFLHRELQQAFRQSLTAFYFAVLALVVAFYGCGMFLRLSRWHLFNVTLTALAFRGFLALFRVLSEGVVFDLSKATENTQALQFLPEAAILVVGGLLVLLDLLFVPFRRWEEA